MGEPRKNQRKDTTDNSHACLGCILYQNNHRETSPVACSDHALGVEIPSL